jgi:hypothetical protein
MERVLLNIVAAVILSGLWLVLLLAVEGCVKIYHRLRAPRVVTCPADHAPAALDLLITPPSRFSNNRAAHLCVRGCSRWPERAECNQICLRQI